MRHGDSWDFRFSFFGVLHEKVLGRRPFSTRLGVEIILHGQHYECCVTWKCQKIYNEVCSLKPKSPTQKSQTRFLKSISFIFWDIKLHLFALSFPFLYTSVNPSLLNFKLSLIFTKCCGRYGYTWGFLIQQYLLTDVRIRKIHSPHFAHFSFL